MQRDEIADFDPVFLTRSNSPCAEKFAPGKGSIDALIYASS
jgi:hypothetical protein